MPVSFPPDLALNEFLGATTKHTRRVEIYEQDAVTRWNKDTVVRLKSGSVTVDHTRDERRTLDLTLANDDEVLINAPGEFWYDKIIKVFRGVRIDEPVRTPRILILSDKTGEEELAPTFRQLLVDNGYGNVQINVLADEYEFDVEPFDIVVALGNATATQIDLLTRAYRNGKSVFIQDADSTTWIQDAFPTASGLLVGNTSVAPVEGSSHSLTKGWEAFTSTGATNTQVFSSSSSEWTQISPYAADPTYSRVIAFEEPSHGGRAVAFSFTITYEDYDTNADLQALALNVVSWLNQVKPLITWEVQIGEFMIDRITEPNFPYEVKITGRDYTKKCMNSKFSHAIQFIEGMSLESVIAAIAGSAGITKRLFPATGVTIGRSFYFERGVTRWAAMKEIVTSYNYELYFDAQGYLVMRPFNDPSTTPPAVYIETGKEGQIASYQKSTSDSRLYNHIIVVGESSDSDIPNVSAEIQNDDPNSPTSVLEIGDRLYEYVSSFIETQIQADEVAASFLAVHSLEEYELSFESLVLPWLEVGDILHWTDPRPAPDDPSIFLLSSMNIPLGLGPMSASAKRVVIV